MFKIQISTFLSKCFRPITLNILDHVPSRANWSWWRGELIGWRSKPRRGVRREFEKRHSFQNCPEPKLLFSMSTFLGTEMPRLIYSPKKCECPHSKIFIEMFCVFVPRDTTYLSHLERSKGSDTKMLYTFSLELIVKREEQPDSLPYVVSERRWVKPCKAFLLQPSRVCSL
jgi:hypothetical protein